MKFQCDFIVNTPEWNSIYKFEFKHTNGQQNFYDAIVLENKVETPRTNHVGHRITALSYDIPFLQRMYDDGYIALKIIPKDILDDELFTIY